MENNDDIKRELDKIFGPREQEMADLKKTNERYARN